MDSAYSFRELKHLKQIVEFEAMERDRRQGYDMKFPESSERNGSDKKKIYVAKRNDPCPCGSEKKFKICCMAQSKNELEKELTRPVQPGVRIKTLSARASCSAPQRLDRP